VAAGAIRTAAAARAAGAAASEAAMTSGAAGSARDGARGCARGPAFGCDPSPARRAHRARDLTARAGRCEPDETTGGPKENRVVVPPGARVLEKGVKVVQDREVQLESSQQLLGD
jgi:hypothetical protein